VTKFASILETEPEHEGPPAGDYIAYPRGFTPRDEITGRPDWFNRQKWTDGKQVFDESGNPITEKAVMWSFGILWPVEFRGIDPVVGNTRWKAIKVVKQAGGTNAIQIERKGTLIAWVIKWAEACGVNWMTDLQLPETGDITDEQLRDAIDKAVLDNARKGRLVHLKINERGYVGGEGDPVTALAAHEAERVAGLRPNVDYSIPYPYKEDFTEQLSLEAGWSEEVVNSGRAYLRDEIIPAFTAGDNMLMFEVAQNSGWIQMLQERDEPGHSKANQLAVWAKEAGYDAFSVDMLGRTICLITGATPQQRLVDALTNEQLGMAIGLPDTRSRGEGLLKKVVIIPRT